MSFDKVYDERPIVHNWKTLYSNFLIHDGHRVPAPFHMNTLSYQPPVAGKPLESSIMDDQIGHEPSSGLIWS